MHLLCKSLLAVLILLGTLYSQSLSIGVSAGKSFIEGDNYFTRDLGPIGAFYINGADHTAYGGLAMKTGYDFSINGKLLFGGLPFSLITQIHYIPFRGTQASQTYSGLIPQPIPILVTSKIDVWSLQIGGRYFTMISNVKPFLTGSFLINNFGATRFQFDYNDEKDYSALFTDYENGVRFGYKFGLGLGYSILEKTDVEIEATYSMMNAANRRGGNPIDSPYATTEERMKTMNILLGVYYNFL